MRRSMISWSVAVCILVATMGAALAQESPQTTPAKKTQGARVFQMVLFKLGPAWVKEKPPMQQPGIQEHAAYMSKLIKEGILVVGGPLMEDPKAMTVNGAVMILMADTAEAAKQILETDPANTSGLLQVLEIRPLIITGASWRPPQAP